MRKQKLSKKKCPQCGKRSLVDTVNGAVCTNCGLRMIQYGRIFEDGPRPMNDVLSKKFPRRFRKED